MNVEIAQRLAARRKQAGLSQEALAEQLGVSRQAVSKWERSESSPDTDNLIALAQLYGVSLDELLYVDDDLRDDVVFEAADRAAAREAEQTTPKSSENSDAASASAADAADTTSADESAGEKKQKVHIGLGGIHVVDGDDYVHVSWRDGVHVKESKKGDEVHVGWDGVHVKEGARARGAEPERGESVFVDDDEGNEIFVDGDSVVINGEEFDSWQDAHERYGYGHIHEDRWYEPCGYTVNGERFRTLDEARAKYGDEVGKSIPVRKHYLREFEKSWTKFPYPLVVIVAYLLLGIFQGAWGLGLFMFFTIPLYYMIGHAISRRRFASFIGGAYPIVATAWFCYMAFVLNQPHPAWAIFLTIPVVECLVVWLSHWWRGRARRKAAKENAPIDVEAQ